MRRNNLVILLWSSVMMGVVIVATKVFQSESVTSSSVSYSLYDLAFDPNEETDIFPQVTDSSSAYYDTVEDMKVQLTRISSSMKSPEIPSSFSKHTFASCGGVCPWEDSDSPTLEQDIEVVYSTDQSPNIIFVMVSNWGWNDVGLRSTYLPWGTPTIDEMAAEGILLENYFTHSSTVPSRGAFLTGRYPYRLGLWGTDSSIGKAELPVEETTLAEELKSVGYTTYMVGKWGVGMSTLSHTPRSRGFDYFYGQLSTDIDPYTKMYAGSYLDLQSDASVVTNEDQLSSDWHTALLYEAKAEAYISKHTTTYPDSPMFMLYSLSLIEDTSYGVPEQYLSRCETPDIDDADTAAELQNYCAQQLMIDEIMANLTCSLIEAGMEANTLVILTSDTGGDDSIRGVNYPFAGGIDSTSRGGLSATAIISGQILSGSSMAGSVYSGLVHVTDWYPTLMYVATSGAWTGSFKGEIEIDGFDLWSAITTNLDSPRSKIVHYVESSTLGSLQHNFVKLDVNGATAKSKAPEFVFSSGDLNPTLSAVSCSYPSLMFPTGLASDDSSIRVYDLSRDPFETSNVYSTYYASDTFETLSELGATWTSEKMLVDPQIAHDESRVSAWTACGGVCPWTIVPSTASSMDSTEPIGGLPNIVFVMIEDFGWNDMHSTYKSWATADLDRLADEGVQASNYFTHSTALPSRAAFLTGKYPARLGLWDELSESTAELPMGETTLAEQLKELGYATYMVGEWGLGMSTNLHLPTSRGFDYFYGQLSNSVDLYSRTTSDGFLDNHDCTATTGCSLDPADDSVHSALLFQSKFEEYLALHAESETGQPIFAYYSIPSLKGTKVDDIYRSRCVFPELDGASEEELEIIYNDCAISVLLNEVIANTTCAVRNMSPSMNNTLIFVVGANGAEETYDVGNNYPYRGGSSTGSSGRGALSVSAVMHGEPLQYVAGSEFSGLMHVTDWYASLIAYATSIQSNPTASTSRLVTDGFDVLTPILTEEILDSSSRETIVHMVGNGFYSVQQGMIKLDVNTPVASSLTAPLFTFESDNNFFASYSSCWQPSLMQVHVDPRTIYYMFDLNADPNEERNLADSKMVSQSVQASMMSKCNDWNALTIDPQEANYDKDTNAFSICGGVCPWLETPDDYSPLVVEQKFDYAEAPNIVFVLVDDWGWNDVGWRSTYMSWTTPTIDRLASEGIKFNNYFSHYSCMPSRGALLTGRYALRLGLSITHEMAELPLSETTLAQELKSAGYHTSMVGKWHLGFSSPAQLPINRGFDYFYGYLNGQIDYWTKSYGSHLDLHEGTEIETDPSILDSSVHNGYVLQAKAEQAIADHATNFADQPLFLYYSMQLIHGEWAAPDSFLSRCTTPPASTGGTEDERVIQQTYCAMNLMLDEALSNLTCTLEAFNMLENTLMIVVSDNGGESTVDGNSFPFRGNKGSHFRGGVSTTGFLHSQLIPESMRGGEYNGQFHITDWLPTLMGLATGGEWTGSYTGAELDGVDMWDAIINNLPSPRSEIVHYADGEYGCSIQIDMMKLDVGDTLLLQKEPAFVFPGDVNPDSSEMYCKSPSLVSSNMAASAQLSIVNAITAKAEADTLFASPRTTPSKSNVAENTFDMTTTDSVALAAIALAIIMALSGLALQLQVLKVSQIKSVASVDNLGETTALLSKDDV